MASFTEPNLPYILNPKPLWHPLQNHPKSKGPTPLWHPLKNPKKSPKVSSVEAAATGAIGPAGTEDAS